MHARVLVIAPVVATVALIAGCSSNSSDKPHASASAGAPAPAGQQSGKEAAYWALLQEDHVTAFSNANEAVAAGNKVCDDIRSGTGAFQAALKLNMSVNDGAAVVAAATTHLCPDVVKK